MYVALSNILTTMRLAIIFHLGKRGRVGREYCFDKINEY